MKYRWNLVSRTTLFEKYFKLDEYTIRHELFDGGYSQDFTRELFDRGPVVAVLPYDPARRRVVLIEQFRIGAIEDPDGPWLIEIVAGVVEPGESTEQVAERECVEEAGCEISQLELISHYHVSPGAINEPCSLYCGLTDSDGLGGVHGLDDENEDIRVLVVDAEQAFAWVREGRVRSAPAMIALLWLELNQQRIDDEWRQARGEQA
jgi:ADP-ribose pyrophosphatase